MDDDDDFISLGNVSPLQEVFQTPVKRPSADNGRVKKHKGSASKTPQEDQSRNDAEDESSASEGSTDLEDYLYLLAEAEHEPPSSIIYDQKVHNDGPSDDSDVLLQPSSSAEIASPAISKTFAPCLDSCVQQMLSLESAESHGGILIEPNGHDKCYLAIEMCLRQRKHMAHGHITSDMVESSGTLIVTVNALVNQWAFFLRKNCPTGTRVFSGKLASLNVFEIARYDFVVTSYAQVRRNIWENEKDSPSTKKMFCISWNRVIFDEANMILSYAKSTYDCLSLGFIRATHRWLLASSPLLPVNIFLRLALYVYALQHPVLSTIDPSCPLSTDTQSSLQNDILLLRFIEISPEAEVKYSAELLNALKVVQIGEKRLYNQRPAFNSGNQQVILQRVRVQTSPREAVFLRCFVNTIHQHLHNARKDIESLPVTYGSLKDHYEKLYRVEIYELCLKLRQACVSPHLVLRYLHSKRGSFEESADIFHDKPTAKDEAKVRIFKNKLGLTEAPAAELPASATAHSPNRTYAKQVFLSLEAKSSPSKSAHDNQECEICFAESLDANGMLLPCGHRMCGNCCQRIIESARKCPFCKKQTAMTDIVSIRVIKRAAQKMQSERTEDSPDATVADLDFKDFFFLESSKSRQLAADIALIMTHHNAHNLQRPKCLIMTEFAEFSLALSNALQAERIATTLLKPSFRLSLPFSRLVKGVGQINQKTLAENERVYRFHTNQGFQKAMFETAPRPTENDIVYEKYSESTMSQVHHSSEDVLGSAVIANTALLSTGIDFSWVDYVFFMEPTVTGVHQIHSAISRMINAKRDRPLRVTLYERHQSFDERVVNLLYGEQLPSEQLDENDHARRKFLTGEAVSEVEPPNLGDNPQEKAKKGAHATKKPRKVVKNKKGNTKENRPSDLSTFFLQAPIEEILQTLGLSSA